MNINYINTGSSPNSGDGDSIRAAFTKVNSNFTEVVNTITNLIVSPGSIGPTGPTGPAGTSSVSGIINTGTARNVAFYSDSGTTITGTNILNFDTQNNLLVIGSNGNQSARVVHVLNEYFNLIPNSQSIASKFTFIECHESQDTNNFSFHRTRGNHNNQQPLLEGDDVADITFTTINSQTATSYVATITASIKNTATNFPSGKLSFLVNNGQSFAPLIPALELEDAIIKVRKIGEIISGENVVIQNNLIPEVDLTTLLGSQTNRWGQAFINTLNISSSIKFPDGTEQTTAGGSGGSFAPSRTTSSITTPGIANNEAVNVTMSGFPGFIIYKISTSHAAWVRIYINDAARTADSARTESEDPRPDAGVITEVLTTQSETILLTPAVYGFTDPASNDLAVSVVNKSGSFTSITVSMVLVQTEA